MFSRALYVAAFCFTLSGCAPWISPPQPRVSEVYIEELRVLGGTHLPGYINSKYRTPACSEDGTYIGNSGAGGFFFSPPMNYATIPQLSDLESGQNVGIDSTDQNFWEAYSFVFSSQNVGSYSIVSGSTLSISDFFRQYEGNEIPNEYTQSVILGIRGSRPGLILYGTYYIEAIPGFVPVNATHAELWFGTSRDEARELLYRVPLENLLTWRTFVQPHIDTSSGTAACNLNIS